MAEFFTEHLYIVAQIIGFCAMGVAIVAYQNNKHKNILLLMVLCCTLWSVHFALLGHWTAVAMNAMNVVRNIVFCFRDRKWGNSRAIPVIFIVLTIIMTVLTYEDWWSIVPFVASIFAIISTWQTDAKMLRYLTIPICILWFSYNLSHGSWAGTANECFAFTSIVVAIIRYDILKKEEKKA